MMKTMKTCVQGIWIASLLFHLLAAEATDRFDRELFAVVRWEILWGQLPSGSHLRSDGATKFAVRLAGRSLSYCSHDLGVCETYRLGESRNWQAIANAVCKGQQSDQDALRAFLGTIPPSLAASGPPPHFVSKEGGFSGVPAEGSGMTWTTATDFGTRSEIARQYRRLRSPQLGSLKEWIRATSVGQHGLKITIPCFASTDPSIYLSITTPGGEHSVETVFWNAEAGKWESADGFSPPADPTVVNEIRRIVDSISCASISL